LSAQGIRITAVRP